MDINELFDDVNNKSKKNKRFILETFPESYIPYATDEKIELKLDDSTIIFNFSKENGKHEYLKKELLFQITFYTDGDKDYLDLSTYYNGNICNRVSRDLSINDVDYLKDFQKMFKIYVLDFSKNKPYALKAYASYLKKHDKGIHSKMCFLALNHFDDTGLLTYSEKTETSINYGMVFTQPIRTISIHYKVINHKIYTSISQIKGLCNISHIKTSQIASESVFKNIFETTESIFSATINSPLFLSDNYNDNALVLNIEDAKNKIEFYIITDSLNKKSELLHFHNHSGEISSEKANKVISIEHSNSGIFNKVNDHYSAIVKPYLLDVCIRYFLTPYYRELFNLKDNEEPNAENIETIKMLTY